MCIYMFTLKYWGAEWYVCVYQRVTQRLSVLSENEMAKGDAFISLSFSQTGWCCSQSQAQKDGMEANVSLGTKDWLSNPIKGRDEWLNKTDDGWSQILIAHPS